jgi:Flagellin and related hook-associated proteins
MIINHNMASLNTYRQLSANNANSAKSLEKLSSGLRINKAGDDAAGLAISEKMRGQIRGLDQAARNSQDAISMIQTAEGSLSETHSILQRMKELATQSASDTNTDSDRAEIQKEINQLTSEINRIGNTTEFNTQKLLNGGGVSPTTATTVSSNGLTVPATLAAGEGATDALGTASNRASASMVLTGTQAGIADGEEFTISIGNKELTISFDTSASTSSVSGNTITIATTGLTTDDLVGAELANQLTSFITNDSSLKGNYAATYTAGTDTLLVQANEVTMDADGKLTGPLDGGVVSAADSDGDTVIAITNSGSKGAYATATIDFTNATVADLKGSEIIIDGNRIAFYDSADGAYDTEAADAADFAIDLNGARTAEKIVDAIVDAMSGTASASVASAIDSSAVYDADNSALANVYLTKTDTTKLQITSQQSGAAGNLFEMGNNAAVTVSETYGNGRLSNESVISAKGLADGEHKVTINYVDADASLADTITGTGTLADGDFTAISIASGSDLEGGTYRLIGDGVTQDDVVVEKLQSDGTWSSTGLSSTYTTASTITALDTSLTIGDITFTFGAYTAGDFDVAGDDYVTFTLDAKHFEATLTEAGSVDSDGDPLAGTAVRVTNGEQNVNLEAEDGIGSAVVNIGAWDVDNFEVGTSISWSFETEQATTDTSEVIGGKFEATFQIGANTAQGMTIEVNDMRSQALKVSGTAAGGSITASNGSVATLKADKEVTNGTNNTSTEYALDVSSHDKATAAISVLDDAIQSVSAERSKLGAYQNRLEHSISNLGTSSENLTAAESRIRDVDMAKEMMQFQKNNILSQAAQAMLAQANQQPQGVLQLLR